jgi:hypothetical protein
MITLETVLKEIFAPERTRQRNQVLVVGGFVLWVFIGIIAHPPALVAVLVRTLGEVIINTFGMLLEPWRLNDVISGVISLVFIIPLIFLEVIQGLLAANVLRHMIAIIVPVYLGIRIAIIYLDDIFELNDQRTAYRYLRSAAFGINPYRLTIENGAVAPYDQDSPIVRVGGPGLAQVNLENVAVFDRVEGEPHIIGPTINRPGLAETLSNFESLRAVIDLRDQMTRANELTVEGRTRDGILISVRDVRMVFSVSRSSAYTGGATTNLTFSYEPEAIFSLVYNRPAGQWTAAMTGLVRGQIQNFLSSHTLSEVLAAVGLPELEEERTHASQITDQAASLTQRVREETSPSSSPDIQAPDIPAFKPRLELTDMFYDRSPNGFQVRARRRGVQLHWINVGTMALPTGPISEIQQEAWRISIENEVVRRELEREKNAARLEELARLIREIPLVTYMELTEGGAQRDEVIASLVSKYLGVIRAAEDEHLRANKPIPPRLETAVRVTSKFLQDYLKKTGQARYLQ